jgi:hypothetical protein
MKDKREEHKKEVRCKRNKRRKNFVPQFSRLSDSCSFLNISVYLSHHSSRTSSAYFISGRERSWRNSQLHRTSLFISLRLTLPILKRGVVVKGKGGEGNETLQVESKPLYSNSAHKRDSSIKKNSFGSSTKLACEGYWKFGTLKCVSMLFSPHPTGEILTFQPADDGRKAFYGVSFLQVASQQLVFVHCSCGNLQIHKPNIEIQCYLCVLHPREVSGSNICPK